MATFTSPSEDFFRRIPLIALELILKIFYTPEEFLLPLTHYPTTERCNLLLPNPFLSPSPLTSLYTDFLHEYVRSMRFPKNPKFLLDFQPFTFIPQCTIDRILALFGSIKLSEPQQFAYYPKSCWQTITFYTHLISKANNKVVRSSIFSFYWHRERLIPFGRITDTSILYFWSRLSPWHWFLKREEEQIRQVFFTSHFLQFYGQYTESECNTIRECFPIQSWF